MTDNIIERAEAEIRTNVEYGTPVPGHTCAELLAALKAARAENERLRQIVYRTGHNLNKAYRD